MFVENLLKLLREIDRNQAWLAKQVGVKSSAVSLWISEETKPSRKNLHKIADAFEVSTDYLLGKENEKYPENSGRKNLSLIKEGGSIAVPLFPDGATLLVARNQSKGNTVERSMAKLEYPLTTDQRFQEDAYAVKVDQMFDCDEKYGMVVVNPWRGVVPKNKPILFTEIPAKKFFIRRVIIQEDGKFIFCEPYKGSNVILGNDIDVWGVVIFSGDFT